MKRLATLAAVLVMAALAAFPGSAPAATNHNPGIKGGKFEVTCKYVHSQQIDPLVSPGLPMSAHLHDFFGNTATNPFSTPTSLVGGSTSCLLSKDTAAYWVPAAFRTDTGAQVKPVKSFLYYFGTPGIPTEPIPAGLELIGGRPPSDPTAPLSKQRIQFSCGNGGKSHSPVRTTPYNCLTEPNVVSQGVVAVALFPYCWDGTGLDRTDVVYGNTNGDCPLGYSHRLPQVQIHTHYGASTSKPGFQRGDLLTFGSPDTSLAPPKNIPPSYFHGDWMNGWNQSKLDALVAGCTAIYKNCGFLNDAHPGPGGK